MSKQSSKSRKSSKPQAATAVRWKRVECKMASSSCQLIHELPENRIPVFARPGMAVSAAQGGDMITNGIIVSMTAANVVVEFPDGAHEVFNWGEIDLSDVRPDPTCISSSLSADGKRLATNTPPVVARPPIRFIGDMPAALLPPAVETFEGANHLLDPQAFAARVRDNAMSPTYPFGTIVVFTTLDNPNNGDDCFVQLSTGERLFRRVEFGQDEFGRATIHLYTIASKSKPPLKIAAHFVTGIWKAAFTYSLANVRDTKPRQTHGAKRK